MTRVGVVDLGTNSTRLLVADVEDGAVREVERRLTITRLGEGVDERAVLLPTAIARVRNALSTTGVRRRGRRRAHAGGRDERRAGRGERRSVPGRDRMELRLRRRAFSSGDEEARLTYRGVANGGALEPGALMVDVGGGSTELISAARLVAFTAASTSAASG